MKTVLVLIFFLVLSVDAQDIFYNVLDYGAKGDGKTNNTAAINAAINAAAGKWRRWLRPPRGPR